MMKGSCTFVASVLAASTAALSSSSGEHDISFSSYCSEVGEVGELSEIFQGKGEVPRGLLDLKEEEKQHLGEELSNVMLYLVRLSDACEVDLGKAVLRKLELNAKKYPVNLCKGSSKKHSQINSDSEECEPGADDKVCYTGADDKFCSTGWGMKLVQKISIPGSAMRSKVCR